MRLFLGAILLLAAQDAEVSAFKPELTRPADFKEFWKRQIEELDRAPVEFKLAQSAELSTPERAVWELKFPSVDGQTEVWGWYASPAQASAERKAPAVVAIPAFKGRRGKGPPGYAGACGLVVGYRGFGDEEWPADWITRGLEKPETSVFRIHYLNMIRAVRFLQGRPEVDAKRIYLEGSSLGAGMTVVVAGLLGPEIAGLTARAPGMAYYFYKDGRPAESSFRQMEHFVAEHADRKETFLHTLGYFAQVNFAPDVKAEALVGCGGKDPLCFPRMVYAVFNHLGGPKEIKVFPEAAHGGPGWTEWTETARAWLEKRLK